MVFAYLSTGRENESDTFLSKTFYTYFLLKFPHSLNVTFFIKLAKKKKEE